MGNSQVIKFSKSGHDAFIDYLKGISIILVVFTHCLPTTIEHYSGFELWGRIAIPIFFIIQVFHIYKHGFEFKQPNYKKLWTRIFRPFLIVQIFIAVIKLTLSNSTTLSVYCEHVLKMGGYGPGEYYPWVYLQFAIITPIIAPIFKRFNSWQLLIIFAIVSQVFEILYCLIGAADWPYYSLSFVRYIFLIYLGYILVTKGFIINNTTIIISLISLGITACFCFLPINYEPFFVTDTQWKYCHWPCYFYITYLCLFLLKIIYDKIVINTILQKWICSIGNVSYEIYLFQMFYFAIISNKIYYIISYININSFYAHVIHIAISLCICIIMPFTIKKFRRK